MSDILVPAPVAIWDEPSTSGAAIVIALLTPYLLTDGSVEFLTRTDTVPGGAVAASVVDSGLGYDQIVTPATTGRRATHNASGVLFLS